MHIINQQLSFLKHVQSFGLFRNLHSPFSRLPTSSEPYYCLDFQHISVNNPRIPVGAEESHVEPDGVTKKEEQRGQSGLRFLRKYLRGPQHPKPLAQNQ
ncbi:PREDICTED: uncharacterized protein LOC106502777 isoform X2 [Capra hircus]|uniref:uncharacterized protein LOC106502777 isoform X2 n=1 Tax=Capra hircus TaxID=9925 RepID=UPI0008462A24|nr:PREDICTED: uncharacterized protein LOC106502777 isoform X2 [Capra hircus]